MTTCSPSNLPYPGIPGFTRRCSSVTKISAETIPFIFVAKVVPVGIMFTPVLPEVEDVQDSDCCADSVANAKPSDAVDSKEFESRV